MKLDFLLDIILSPFVLLFVMLCKLLEYLGFDIFEKIEDAEIRKNKLYESVNK